MYLWFSYYLLFINKSFSSEYIIQFLWLIGQLSCRSNSMHPTNRQELIVFRVQFSDIRSLGRWYLAHAGHLLPLNLLRLRLRGVLLMLQLTFILPLISITQILSLIHLNDFFLLLLFLSIKVFIILLTNFLLIILLLLMCHWFIWCRVLRIEVLCLS